MAKSFGFKDERTAYLFGFRSSPELLMASFNRSLSSSSSSLLLQDACSMKLHSRRKPRACPLSWAWPTAIKSSDHYTHCDHQAVKDIIGTFSVVKNVEREGQRRQASREAPTYTSRHVERRGEQVLCRL